VPVYYCVLIWIQKINTFSLSLLICQTW